MRILVIEDDAKIARLLQKALEKETYAVDVARTGDEGFSLATSEPYDAAIINRSLPEAYDGLSIVSAMREAQIHTPVLILSSLDSPKEKTIGLYAGADDYLGKPFAIEELVARVKALLRRPAEQQPDIITVGDLSLNVITFEVKRGDIVIDLTSKEYALLEYLMRNQGRPMSKETIISHVWDFDADILPNTVEVYIKFLRNKIDEPFQSPLIHTVRGFGYKLEAPDVSA